LQVAFWLAGELRGHSHRDVIDYASAMAELGDVEPLVSGTPANIVSPDVEPSGWRSWLRRRR
jgi:hypothetical protein